MNRTTISLTLVLSLAAFAQPADAPLLEPKPRSLTPQWFEQEHARARGLDHGGRALRGLAITSTVVGGLALAGYGIGATINLVNSISASINGLLASAFTGRGSTSRYRPMDLTPLLVTAIVGPALGFVTGVSGIALSSTASARHEALDALQAATLKQAQDAFWARMDAEAARVVSRPADAAEPAPSLDTPTDPPAPPDHDAPRKPLVPRQP